VPNGPNRNYGIRTARPGEYSRLGRLTVDAYASLPGMPTVDAQPEYYARLLDVAQRAGNPAISVFAAVSDSGALLGSVDFIADMKAYASGGSANTVPDAAGIRLLAVAPECRGRGVGKALTLFCVEHARRLGRSTVVLHSTRAMSTAWAMYERMGFERFPELDFRQGNLDVFGFRLKLAPDPKSVDLA
jgi:ribosomal protein S18 acetylase RimI-like enzyme